MNRTAPLFLSLAALLMACGENGKDDTAQESAFSCETTPTVLALEEASALGFSGADVLALAQGSHTAVFTWTDGTPTDLTLDVTWDAGEVRFMDAEPKDDGSGMEPAVECSDWVEVDVTFHFATADGAFDETWDGPLSAADALVAAFTRELALDGLTGSLDVTAMLPESYDAAHIDIDGSFSADGTMGDAYLFTEGHDGEGDDGTAWAGQDSLGSWGR